MTLTGLSGECLVVSTNATRLFKDINVTIAYHVLKICLSLLMHSYVLYLPFISDHDYC